MAWTIGPAGSGVERNRNLRLHCMCLLLGASTSAAIFILVGAGFRAAVPNPPTLTWVAVALVFLGWSLRSLGLRGLPYPRSRWQVPEHWRASLPLPFTLAGYGYILGTGVFTDVVLPAFWMLVTLTVLSTASAVIPIAWLAYAGARITRTVQDTACAAACPVNSAPSIVHPQPGIRALRFATLSFAATVASLVLLSV